MDFGTITEKIDDRQYNTMGQLAADIELVFAKQVPSVCVRLIPVVVANSITPVIKLQF